MTRLGVRLCAGCAAAGIAAAGAAARAQEAAGPANPAEAIAAGRPIFEMRARYEGVDQTRTAVLTQDAQALTLRTVLGWETAEWRGLKGLVEFEDVRALSERYAVNPPGATTPPLNGADKARYPLVNNPETTELNRAQISWSPSQAFSAVVGRQRIVIDDQRFVGGVAWRQDEQTFDAARLDATFGRFKATYAYVDKVNRILAEDRDWSSDSHLATLSYAPAEALRLQGFVYALDFANSAANSSITKGVKASGKTWISLYQLTYEATYARQTDWANNPQAFALDFHSLSAAGTFDIYTAKLTYESLEGNGVRGFTMPLSTAHAFNGWSDAFVQPLGAQKGFVDGLEDRNASLIVKPRVRFTWLYNLDFIVRYHDFDAQRTGANLGHEWDAQLTGQITPRISAAVKYADFQRVRTVAPGTAAPPASRTKVWFTLEFKL